MPVSTTSPSAAGPALPAAASALLERHGAALRTYLGQLPGADARRIEGVMHDAGVALGAAGEIDDEPVVWLFARARQQLVGAGQRAEVLLADVAETDEAIETDNDAAAAHRAFGRLTGKQQEALRLKFQFGFDTAEVARITGLSGSGAAGLLQHAMGRIVHAMPAAPGASGVRVGDPRLIAYALDEMGPEEKRAFVESFADGKALLEASEVVRRAAHELKHLLETGAPPPRRRRAKRGVPAWVWTVAFMGLAIGGFAWWRLASATPQEESASRSTPAASKRADERISGGRSTAEGTKRETPAVVRTKANRELRPGEADWERKAFGRGQREAAAGADGGAAEKSRGGRDETSPRSEAASRREDPARRADEENVVENHDEDVPAVAWPTGSAGGVGAVGAGEPAGKPRNSPGAAVGSNSMQQQAIFSGKVNEGLAQKSAGHGMARPLSGLAEAKRQLRSGVWPQPAPIPAKDWLPPAPLERRMPAAPSAPVEVQAEIAPSPFSPGRQVVRVVVLARPGPPPVRAPASIVFAIDVSDSMDAPNRLPLVREGVRRLAERLRPDDRVAIVTYAATARVVRASAALGEGVGELRASLEALEAGGRTNGHEGLSLAYETARGARSESGPTVVILCTDGSFNLGETDEHVLAEMAGRASADGIALSVFGFGRSDRNDPRLELLARQGGGRSCYVNTRDEAERLLAGQVDGLLEPVAAQVGWRVAFNPARATRARRLAGEDEAVTAELLPGRGLAALYEFDARGAIGGEWGEVKVNYTHARTRESAQVVHVLEGRIADDARTSPEFRFAVAMAELGRVLHDAPERAPAALDRLEEWAATSLPDDAGGYRRELLETVALARGAATGRGGR